MSGVRRGPRNSVHDRPGRLAIALRRLRRMSRPVAWTAFGLVILALIAEGTHAGAGGLMGSLRMRMAAAAAGLGLRVDHVVIEGRQNTPEPLLNAALGIEPGEPIFGFSLENVRRNVERLSWVEYATIERRLPDTVVVHLAERRPFAIWQNHGKFVLIDRTGQIVANQDMAAFKQLPLVVGRGAPEAAAPLIDALMDRPALLARMIGAVRVDDRRWNLAMKGGISVMLPEGHEIPALDRLMSLQQDHDLLDRPLDVIDLRLPDQLVLRPHIDPSADTATKKPS